MSLEPGGGQSIISILFRPLELKTYTATLLVERTNLCQSTFQFPIYGYGGRANLTAFTAAGLPLEEGHGNLRVMRVDSKADDFKFFMRNVGNR